VAVVKKDTKFSAPLMLAFRQAFEKKDARKQSDERNEAGERVLTKGRSKRALVEEKDLRKNLADDLNILLNTVNFGSIEDLGGLAQVRHSILNFGLPDIVHRTIDENRTEQIIDEIHTAIGDYEPRLIRDTVRVARDYSIDTATLNIRFIVDGDMSCNPADVPVEFVADLELTSGRLAINKR